MSELKDRYPGLRSFEDDDFERKLFFGRDKEAHTLLYLVLAENLVVLFAKSGIGKTSLINAGLLQPLRDHGCIPFKIRFRDDGRDPLQTIYTEIEKEVEELKFENTPGERQSLWQYFKTAEFWDKNNFLLTPVLILDQFEEFFRYYTQKEREKFITQLAELGKETTIEGHPSQTATPPRVKILISIRDDYLGLLEEMAVEIPGIFRNRFRLTALQWEQASKAITMPAQIEIEDCAFAVEPFNYAHDTIEMMLNFLCEKQEREPGARTKEVEVFTIQLLCHHIEKEIKGTDKKLVLRSMLGGVDGMREMIESFYSDSIEQLSSPEEKEVARQVCEEILIYENHRISSPERKIINETGISSETLDKLEELRLLRREEGVGGKYYELSHDTLVEPILQSRQKREEEEKRQEFELRLYNLSEEFQRQEEKVKNQRKIRYVIVFSVITFIISLITSYIYFNYNNTAGKLLNFIGKYNKALEWHQKAIKKDYTKTSYYSDWVRTFSKCNEPDSAIDEFFSAISSSVKSLENPGGIEPYEAALMAYNMGEAFGKEDKYDEAIPFYQKTIELDPEYNYAYYRLGIAFYYQKRYNEAKEKFQKVIKLKEDDIIYYRLYRADTLRFLGDIKGAIKDYEEVITRDPKNSYALNRLGLLYYTQGNNDLAEENYRKALKVNYRDDWAYENLGDLFLEQQNYDLATENYQRSIKINPGYAENHKNLGDVYFKQKKYNEAIQSYKKAIELDPKFFLAYEKLGDISLENEKYDEAFNYYRQASEIEPEDTSAYEKLGDISVKQKKYAEASEYYQKVLNLGESFKLTVQSFKGLRDESISKNILEKLKPLENAEIISEDKFLHTIKKHIGEEETVRYQMLILQHADIKIKNGDVYKKLGDIYTQQNEVQKAIKYYKRIEVMKPEITAQLINLYISQEEFNLALEKYQQYIEKQLISYYSVYSNYSNSSFATIRQKLILSLKSLDQVKYIDKVNEITFNSYQNVIAFSPIHPSSSLYRDFSVLCIKYGKIKQALEMYKKSLAVEAKEMFMIPFQSIFYLPWSTYTVIAGEFRRREMQDEVEQVYEIASIYYSELIQISPNDRYLYYLNARLAMIFSEWNKYDAAIEHYQKLLNIINTPVFFQKLTTTLYRPPQPFYPYGYSPYGQPSYPYGYSPYGQPSYPYGYSPPYGQPFYSYGYSPYGQPSNSYGYASGQPSLSYWDIYRQMVLIHIYAELTLLYAKQGNLEDTIKFYQYYLEDIAGYSDTRSNLYSMSSSVPFPPAIRMSLIEIFQKKRMKTSIEKIYTAEVEHYKRAIRFNPEHPENYYSLGLTYYDQKKYEEARENFQQAGKMNFNSAYTYLWLGHIFFLEGRQLEAIESYDEAINSAPDNIFIKIYLVENYLLMSRFEEVSILAQEIQNRLEEMEQDQEIFISDIFAVQFLDITSLFFQGKQTEAFNKLEGFIDYYKSVNATYQNFWTWDQIKKFISTTNELSKFNKTLLLVLIDVLEVQKTEADEKFEEFEALLEKRPLE